LRAFLDAEEPQSIQWLVRSWGQQQSAVTYGELREAILAGHFSEERLAQWRLDYSSLVNSRLVPAWERAFLSLSAAREYSRVRAAELVTGLVETQGEALRALIDRAVYTDMLPANELARLMRPVIGLDKRAALANLRYYGRVKANLIEGGARAAIAESRAREAALRYAGRQHRYRAQMIARTELSAAYNRGAYSAVKEAQSAGLIGDVVKVWRTAGDSRVCAVCSGLDGERVNEDSMFSGGGFLPPAHPHCRCCVEYAEIMENLLTNLRGGGIMESGGGENTESLGSDRAVMECEIIGVTTSDGDVVERVNP